MQPLKRNATRSMNRGDSLAARGGMWGQPNPDINKYGQTGKIDPETQKKLDKQSEDLAKKYGITGQNATHGKKQFSVAGSEHPTDMHPANAAELAKHGYKYKGTGHEGYHRYERPDGHGAHSKGSSTYLSLHGQGISEQLLGSGKLGRKLEELHGPAKGAELAAISAAPSFEPGAKPRKEDEAYFAADDTPMGVDKDHHAILIKHGYTAHSGNGKMHFYRHPGGKTAIHHNGNTAIGNGVHSKTYRDHAALDYAIRHGKDVDPPSAEQKDRVGKFEDGPAQFAAGRHTFHQVLTKHGYKHTGSSEGTGGDEHIYEHKDGHVASYWAGSGAYEKPHHRMEPTVFHTHAKHLKGKAGEDYGGEHDTVHDTAGHLDRHLTKLHGPAKGQPSKDRMPRIGDGDK